MSMLDFKPYEGDALIVVDMQNDFITGTLPVAGADTKKFIESVNYWITYFNNNKLPIIYTRDWHPPNHISFAKEGEEPNWVDTFPPHCISVTHGAKFDERLIVKDPAIVVHKGAYVDREEFSGFEALKDGESYLHKLLDEKLDVNRVFVCGLATDYCVKNTVLDAIDYGYDTVLLSDAIKAVVPSIQGLEAIGEMVVKGAYVIY